MTFLRRHLASLGLAVALCQLVMQVFVPAALCCQKPRSSSRIEATDCCLAGSHPGQVCPMHRASRAVEQQSKDTECHAKPMVDLHDMFVALIAGGILPSVSQLAVPHGSELVARPARAATPDVAAIPPAHPPRT
jgi:hypothetical protein